MNSTENWIIKKETNFCRGKDFSYHCHCKKECFRDDSVQKMPKNICEVYFYSSLKSTVHKTWVQGCRIFRVSTFTVPANPSFPNLSHRFSHKISSTLKRGPFSSTFLWPLNAVSPLIFRSYANFLMPGQARDQAFSAPLLKFWEKVVQSSNQMSLGLVLIDWGTTSRSSWAWK